MNHNVNIYQHGPGRSKTNCKDIGYCVSSDVELRLISIFTSFLPLYY